ncbi:Metallo-dependent phosphatase-like protein [Ilyonectria destructans]|nr:Metallo-dependent phosphatase-like protein [Ilyonectria destructans]
MTSIKTRFLILSDTHGLSFSADRHPHHHADVAIHCGDLTEESKLAEFRTSLELLRSLNAPLKLVIAGNHDFTLNILMFKKKVAEVRPPLEPELVTKEYGSWGEVSQLFEEAKQEGIIFLNEGTHRFKLENGALLRVFTSPFTPSLNDWGFQYHPRDGHNYPIQDGTDVVITHGPPRGVMDLMESRKRVGCPDLFAAVAMTRPKLHCFGHIHEGWGGRLVSWREKTSEIPSHFIDIDNNKSVLIENLSGLKRSKFDDDNTALEKANKAKACIKDRCYRTSHCAGDGNPLTNGKQTLFVNASIKGDADDQPMQLPWLVDIELLPAQSNSAVENEISERKNEKRKTRDEEYEPNIKSLVKRAKNVKKDWLNHNLGAY